MDIRTNDGSSFHLSVIGYQFPENANDKWDANWLIMHLAVKLPQGAWSVTDPFFLTCEVESLADWLDSVAHNSQTESEIGFTEPNLRFEVINPTDKDKDGDGYLRVHFALECLPPWAGRSEHGTEDVFADFPLSEIDLRAAAEALRHQLDVYPQRPVS